MFEDYAYMKGEELFDLLIKNARIYDGSAVPAYYGSVAVKGGKIVQIGSDLGQAAKTVDAEGLDLSPGFVDSHSHGDLAIFTDPNRDHVLQMGVTTEITGNCGHARFPIMESVTEDQLKLMLGSAGQGNERFERLSYMREALKDLPIGPNQAHLAGHNLLRCSAMSFASRSASEAELNDMRRMAREAMEDGAEGFSTGLCYIPGVYGDSHELIELAKVTSIEGGIYCTHSRWESAGLFRSLQECIDIAREAKIPVNVSHLKCTGKDFWHRCEPMLAMVDEANREGMTVTMDAYPYTACSTNATTSVIPARFFELGMPAFLKMLDDPNIVEEIRCEIFEIDDPSWDNGALHVGLENFLITGADVTPEVVGKTYVQVAQERGITPYQAMIDVIRANNGAVREVRYSMCEENVEMILRHPLCVVGSDGVYVKGRDTMTHPRAIGTFPRYLGRYIRNRGILSREEGIHRITGMPSQRFGLVGKGFIRPGYDADLVLFDFDVISDRGDFMEPFRLNEGIHQVYMNGELIMQDNQMTGLHIGKSLRRGRKPGGEA